jgi:hypothetical protein
MALIFPLSAAGFLDILPVQSVQFHCPPQTAATGFAGGDVIRAEVAPQMWQGSYSLPPMRPRVAASFEVLIEALQGVGGSFYAYKKNQIGPASDPRGIALSGRSVEIYSVDVSGSRLRLSGLPPGFVLSAGDFVDFNYGAGPVARALHRFQAGGAASAGGVSGWLPLSPHIEPGALAGAAVSLVRPACKAVIVPGTVDPGVTLGNLTSGAAFSFRQTFR